MPNTDSQGSLSAAEHANAMADYIREGTPQAHALGNRGPIRLDADGKLEADILDAYWRCGFYVFEQVLAATELSELRADIDRVLAGAPVEAGGEHDAQGRPAIGLEFSRPSFNFAKPLGDPVGGTTKNKGRHPVRMLDPIPSADSPASTIANLSGNLQLMDSCLRLYGHPGLLAVAEAVLGADFVPYNEVAFIKEPGLGPSVAWHRDGTTHWDAPDWDHGAHGFNFMVQLYPSTPGNGVWVLPGTHKLVEVDIKQLVAESGSERIRGAVPLLCEAGDAFIVNRQMIHGSFANTSSERRVTLNEGFFPRRRVENITTTRLDDKPDTYDTARVVERSRIIALAIDARRQHYRDERPYHYQPLAGKEDQNRWSEETRQLLLRNYNLQDMYI
ncbi:MAG: phytanoyl-CoA dioxygenase family protein [Gammaproteobacteria bacterium]|nr:phytanoyl-CoA dioxygenase family protein [Gammaproteobacteria bacterium]